MKLTKEERTKTTYEIDGVKNADSVITTERLIKILVQIFIKEEKSII